MFWAPSLAATPLRLPATSYGYDGLHANLYPSDDYYFVSVGAITHSGDQYWDWRSGGWMEIDSTPDYIGDTITADWAPVQRRFKSTAPDGPSKWTCGHGREQNDTKCIVCYAIGYPQPKEVI